MYSLFLMIRVDYLVVQVW